MSSKIQIGKGTFGTVFLETNFHPKIASKYILQSTDSHTEQAFRREWESLKILSHPNIIQVYELDQEMFCGKSHYVIKMEYCSRESLRQVLRDPKIIYSMKTFYCWAEHLLAGLVCLEKHKMIHRDLKPENVLVTNAFTLKLGDFGCVRLFDAIGEMSKDGTLRYMSPEYAGYALPTGKRMINYKSDLYAVGLIMWEILERRKVFSDYEELIIFQKLLTGKLRLEPPSGPEEAKQIVMSCARLEHQLRPTAGSVHRNIVELRRACTKHDFEPIIRLDHDSIIKPVDFDEHSDYLTNRISMISVAETYFDQTLVPGQINTIIANFSMEEFLKQKYLEEIEKLKLNKIILDEDISRKAFENILPVLSNNPNHEILIETFEKRRNEMEEIARNSEFSFTEKSKPPEFPGFFDRNLIDLLVLCKFELERGKFLIENLCSWQMQFEKDFQLIYWIYDEALKLLWKYQDEEFEGIAKDVGKEFHDVIAKLQHLRLHPSGLERLRIRLKRSREARKRFEGFLARYCDDQELYINWMVLLESLNWYTGHSYTLSFSHIDDPTRSLFRGMSTALLGQKVRNFSRKLNYNFENYIFDWFYGPNSSRWCWQLTLGKGELVEYETLHNTIYRLFDHYFGLKNERSRPLNINGENLKGEAKTEALRKFFSSKLNCPNYFLFFRAANDEEKHLRDLVIPLEIPKESEKEENCLCINIKLGCIMYEKLSLKNFCFDSFAVLTFDEIQTMAFMYLTFAETELDKWPNEERDLKKREFLSQLFAAYFLREQVETKDLNNEFCSIESIRF